MTSSDCLMPKAKHHVEAADSSGTHPLHSPVFAESDPSGYQLRTVIQMGLHLSSVAQGSGFTRIT